VTGGRDDIAYRMRDYFVRQIVWFEQMVDQLVSLRQHPLNPEAIEMVAENERVRMRRTQELEEEFEVLKKEWDSTPSISESDRIEIKRLAARAEELTTELMQHYDALAKEANAAHADLRNRLNELGRGRGMLHSYKIDASPAPNYLDKKT